MKTIGEKGGGIFIAGGVVYNLSRSRYGKRLVQSTTRDYGNARWLGRANGRFDGISMCKPSHNVFKSTHQRGQTSRTRSRKLSSSFRSQRRHFRSTRRGKASSGLTRFQLESNLCVLPPTGTTTTDSRLAWPSRQEGQPCEGAAKESSHPCSNL